MSLRLLKSFLLVILPVFLFAQSGIINNFEDTDVNADTSWWGYEISESADDTLSFVDISYVESPVNEGTMAMQLDYSAHNIESWGGYAKIEHYHPDSMSVYDFSAYDSISFDYYVSAAQTLAGRIHLRFNLYDVSDSENGNNTYSVTEAEHYYSFHYILDETPGWHRATLALDRSDDYGGTSYTLTGWSGITGNGVLDKDKIKGFSFEFSISGSGDGDHSNGTIVIDDIALRGLQGVDFIMFNGKSLAASLEGFTWGQSSMVVEEGAGATEGTNALKWTMGDEWGNGWTGAGWNISPAVNFLGAWDKDSLRFKMKAPAGTAEMIVQFEDGTAKRAHFFTPTGDDAWHTYAFKLSEFVYADGTSNFDSTAVTVFQIMANGNAVAGTEIYIDDLWTGDPEIDIIPPGEVENFTAVPVASGNYNIVSWSDFSDEENEQYMVYASENPITNVEDMSVDYLGTYPRGEQAGYHYLHYPLVDKEVTMYYAVQCEDAFGNVGTLTTAGPITNTAKGIATISLTPPVDLAIDGDVLEWENSGIMPFELKKSTAFISTGSFTDDDDMTSYVYLAMDNENLYVAVHNFDDNYYFDSGSDWWTQDAFEVFIGLYDAHGKKHASFLRGEEPDYKIILKESGPAREPTWVDLPDTVAGAPIFWFEDWGAGEYVYEVKIPFDSLKLDEDIIFTPQNGMRIPLELTAHDNDNGTSEGNLTTSNTNNDNAYLTPEVWSYTWIGDTTATAIGDDNRGIVSSFDLEQNYPNPFNPVTNIRYSVGKMSKVELAVYNVLGQKVKTLVKSTQQQGTYKVRLDASDFATGVYFYKLQAGDFTQIRKMILVK